MPCYAGRGFGAHSIDKPFAITRGMAGTVVEIQKKRV
jgi:hypothetical protein